MNRLLVALLAALDALLAAAGGLAVVLAPLTLLWIFGFGEAADWGALWPVGAMLWQLGHLVPVTLTLPDAYLVSAGIAPEAAAFVVSLAPLALALFTAVFAARSGGRAALSGAPLTGAVAGSLVFAALSTGVAVTGAVPLATTEPWQAILFPALVFAAPCAIGAFVGAWTHGIPPVSALVDRLDRAPGAWALVPGLVARGAGIAVAGLVGCGALLVAVAVLVRGGQVIALFQAGNVDVVGATVLALGQLLYLPTLVVWGVAFVAGPGFALGTATAVSPAGTQLGVVPGVPVLGALPESTSPWLLSLALLPVAVGALTGWMLRSRLARATSVSATLGPRAGVLAGVVLLGAGAAALLAVCASGSIGPGRLVQTGPAPGPVALAVGLELAVGAGILLLSPARRVDDREPDLAPVGGARRALRDRAADLDTDGSSVPPESLHAGRRPDALPTAVLDHPTSVSTSPRTPTSVPTSAPPPASAQTSTSARTPASPSPSPASPTPSRTAPPALGAASADPAVDLPAPSPPARTDPDPAAPSTSDGASDDGATEPIPGFERGSGTGRDGSVD